MKDSRKYNNSPKHFHPQNCSSKAHGLSWDKFNFDDLSLSEMWKGDWKKVLGAWSKTIFSMRMWCGSFSKQHAPQKANDLGIPRKGLLTVSDLRSLIRERTSNLDHDQNPQTICFPSYAWEGKSIETFGCAGYHTPRDLINSDYIAPRDKMYCIIWWEASKPLCSMLEQIRPAMGNYWKLWKKWTYLLYLIHFGTCHKIFSQAPFSFSA